MSKKNLTITIASLTLLCLVAIVAFTSNNKTEDTSLSVDTNVSVDGSQDKAENDWVQLQKDELPYQAEGDLHVPVKDENEVVFDEDLSDLTVGNLKEVFEVDEETGFTTGITQGNNVVTIVPEEYAGHFDSDYSDIIDESNMTIPADILAMMDIPKTTTEGWQEAQQAIENSTYVSGAIWGSN